MVLAEECMFALGMDIEMLSLEVTFMKSKVFSIKICELGIACKSLFKVCTLEF